VQGGGLPYLLEVDTTIWKCHCFTFCESLFESEEVFGEFGLPITRVRRSPEAPEKPRRCCRSEVKPLWLVDIDRAYAKGIDIQL